MQEALFRHLHHRRNVQSLRSTQIYTENGFTIVWNFATLLGISSQLIVPQIIVGEIDEAAENTQPAALSPTR
jgi:hypothetical protein